MPCMLLCLALTLLTQFTIKKEQHNLIYLFQTTVMLVDHILYFEMESGARSMV